MPEPEQDVLSWSHHFCSENRKILMEMQFIGMETG
jgi:hypothetical protein